MRWVIPRFAVRTGAAVLCLTAAALGWTFRDQASDLIGRDEPAVIRAFEADTLADKGPILLKVQEYGLSNFKHEYLKPYIIRHPDVEVVTVKPADQMHGNVYSGPTTDDIRAFIREQKPDVLQLPFNLYAELARDGLLKPIDELARKDGYDLAGMHEPVVKALREAGGGTLYGLTDSFETNAVFVNKELFERHGIPLPQDGMTWTELLGVAAKFKGTSVAGISGSYESDPFMWVRMIGETEGLQSVSADGKRATVDSNGWEAVWNQVLEGVKEGWIYTEEREDKKSGMTVSPLDGDAFAEGKAAMTYASGFYMSRLIEEQEKRKLEWMVITEPVNRDRRSLATHLTVSNVYAIAADTTNTDAAWELVKLVGSIERAAMMSGLSYNLPVRASKLEGLKPEQKEAFYKLDADPDLLVRNAAKEGNTLVKAAMLAEYREGTKLFGEAAAGRMSVGEAMESLQDEVQQALLQAETAREAAK